MDNCEHVIGESARVVEQLLVHCPLLRVLATSREALGLGGETIWPVPPLAIEDAVELFTDRAGAAGAADGLARCQLPSSRTSARGSTAFRWPSSWRPPGCA